MLKWSRLIGRHVSTGHGMWRPLSPVTRHYQWRGDKSRVAKDQEVTGSKEEAHVLCPLKDVAGKDSRWERRKLTREPERQPSTLAGTKEGQVERIKQGDTQG